MKEFQKKIREFALEKKNTQKLKTSQIFVEELVGGMIRDEFVPLLNRCLVDGYNKDGDEQPGWLIMEQAAQQCVGTPFAKAIDYLNNTISIDLLLEKSIRALHETKLRAFWCLALKYVFNMVIYLLSIFVVTRMDMQHLTRCVTL